MVVGEGPLQDVDDRWIILVAMETDMATRLHSRPTDAQLTIFDAFYFFGEIDRGEQRLTDPLVIRGRALLSERKSHAKWGQPDRRPRNDVKGRRLSQTPYRGMVIPEHAQILLRSAEQPL